MLPAAISCSFGFHTWVRLRSISVISNFPLRPYLSPRRVASSSPPAPPPTITTRGFPDCASLMMASTDRVHSLPNRVFRSGSLGHRIRGRNGSHVHDAADGGGPRENVSWLR